MRVIFRRTRHYVPSPSRLFREVLSPKAAHEEQARKSNGGESGCGRLRNNLKLKSFEVRVLFECRDRCRGARKATNRDLSFEPTRSSCGLGPGWPGGGVPSQDNQIGRAAHGTARHLHGSGIKDPIKCQGYPTFAIARQGVSCGSVNDFDSADEPGCRISPLIQNEWLSRRARQEVIVEGAKPTLRRCTREHGQQAQRDQNRRLHERC